MKNINLKNLIPAMTLKQKAQLLFDDHALRTRTRGQEHVLSSEEEEVLIADCRKKNQIAELNRLGSYNMATGLALSCLSTVMVELELTIARMGGVLGIMTSRARASDVFESVMDVVSKKAPKLLREIEAKFPPAWTEEEDCAILEEVGEGTGMYRPSSTLQKGFVACLNTYKTLKQGVFIFELIQEKAGMDFMKTESDRKIIDDAKTGLKRFEDMEDWLAVMKVFRSYYEAHLMDGVEFKEVKFQKLMIEPDSVLELSEEEKIEMEEVLEWQLKHF